MVARKRLIAAAVALMGLLASHALRAEAEAPPVSSAPKPAELGFDPQQFRHEIDAYVREHGLKTREALNQELRRELSKRVTLALNELRTRS